MSEKQPDWFSSPSSSASVCVTRRLSLSLPPPHWRGVRRRHSTLDSSALCSGEWWRRGAAGAAVHTHKAQAHREYGMVLTADCMNRSCSPLSVPCRPLLLTALANQQLTQPVPLDESKLPYTCPALIRCGRTPERCACLVWPPRHADLAPAKGRLL